MTDKSTKWQNNPVSWTEMKMVFEIIANFKVTNAYKHTNNQPNTKTSKR